MDTRCAFRQKADVGEVKGTDNPADIGTKYLMAHEVKAVAEKFGFSMKPRRT